MGAREEVTLRQHFHRAKGSWRMAPGVSAESRRIRGGLAVSKSACGSGRCSGWLGHRVLTDGWTWQMCFSVAKSAGKSRGKRCGTAPMWCTVIPGSRLPLRLAVQCTVNRYVHQVPYTGKRFCLLLVFSPLTLLLIKM